jgi:hypothetical protein
MTTQSGAHCFPLTPSRPPLTPAFSLVVLTMPWIPQPTDGLSTETLKLQSDAESIISSLLTEHQSSSASPLLQKSQHTSFLTRFLRQPLPRMFTGLDASRPWILYWAVHSLALFNADLDEASKGRMVETLKRCQNEDGGFGGGPGQMSHLAPSYASVCALAYAGEEGWKAIDRFVFLPFLALLCLRRSKGRTDLPSTCRPGLYRFLLSLKQPDGSFIMHHSGEVDVRSVSFHVFPPSFPPLTPPYLSQRRLLRPHNRHPPEPPHPRPRRLHFLLRLLLPNLRRWSRVLRASLRLLSLYPRSSR